MVVSSNIRRAGPFEGTDLTRNFTFTFRTLNPSDIVVAYKTQQGVERLADASNYQVVLNPDQNVKAGGYIIWHENLKRGEFLVIYSHQPFDQPVKIPELGGWNAPLLQNLFDRATMLLQEVHERSSRAITLSPFSDIDPDTIATKIEEASLQIHELAKEVASNSSIAQIAQDETIIRANQVEATSFKVAQFLEATELKLNKLNQDLAGGEALALRIEATYQETDKLAGEVKSTHVDVADGVKKITDALQSLKKEVASAGNIALQLQAVHRDKEYISSMIRTVSDKIAGYTQYRAGLIYPEEVLKISNLRIEERADAPPSSGKKHRLLADLSSPLLIRISVPAKKALAALKGITPDTLARANASIAEYKLLMKGGEIYKQNVLLGELERLTPEEIINIFSMFSPEIAAYAQNTVELPSIAVDLSALIPDIDTRLDTQDRYIYFTYDVSSKTFTPHASASPPLSTDAIMIAKINIGDLGKKYEAFPMLTAQKQQFVTALKAYEDGGIFTVQQHDNATSKLDITDVAVPSQYIVNLSSVSDGSIFRLSAQTPIRFRIAYITHGGHLVVTDETTDLPKGKVVQGGLVIDAGQDTTTVAVLLLNPWSGEVLLTFFEGGMYTITGSAGITAVARHHNLVGKLSQITPPATTLSSRMLIGHMILTKDGKLDGATESFVPASATGGTTMLQPLFNRLTGLGDVNGNTAQADTVPMLDGATRQFNFVHVLETEHRKMKLEDIPVRDGEYDILPTSAFLPHNHKNYVRVRVQFVLNEFLNLIAYADDGSEMRWSYTRIKHTPPIAFIKLSDAFADVGNSDDARREWFDPTGLAPVQLDTAVFDQLKHAVNSLQMPFGDGWWQLPTGHVVITIVAHMGRPTPLPVSVSKVLFAIANNSSATQHLTPTLTPTNEVILHAELHPNPDKTVTVYSTSAQVLIIAKK